ncbi:MAG: hypothetical protein AB7E85_03265 [Pseudobdellovibrionaceae bacterium]
MLFIKDARFSEVGMVPMEAWNQTSFDLFTVMFLDMSLILSSRMPLILKSMGQISKDGVESLARWKVAVITRGLKLNKSLQPYLPERFANSVPLCLSLIFLLMAMLSTGLSGVPAPLSTADLRVIEAAQAATLPAEAETLAMNFPRYDHPADKLVDLVAYQPETLTTLSGEDIFAMLDRPDLQRRDGQRVVLQYRSEVCVADFGFSVPAGSSVDTQLVESYRMRSRDTVIAEKKTEFATAFEDKGAQRRCFNSIIDEKRKNGSLFKFAEAEPNTLPGTFSHIY